jgi:hypothetical protein
MTYSLAMLGLSVVQRTLPDTIVMRQVTTGPHWFEVIVGIAQIIIAASILVFVVVVVLTGLGLIRKVRSGFIKHMATDIPPLVKSLSRIAAGTEHIVEAVRDDVQQLNKTVKYANQRLTAGIEGAERRIREIDALIDLAQHEVESAFVTTAAAIRGVGAGATALRLRDRKPVPPRDRAARPRSEPAPAPTAAREATAAPPPNEPESDAAEDDGRERPRARSRRGA